jgi:hypothetical protein
MTACKRGDVVLVRVPREDCVKASLRPAVVLHPGDPSDTGIGLLPLVPAEAAGDRAIDVLRGSFEAARMGLVTSVCLDPDLTMDYPRELVVKVIGRCPYVLLNEVIRRRRSPLASVTRFADAEAKWQALPSDDLPEAVSSRKVVAMPFREEATSTPGTEAGGKPHCRDGCAPG